MEARSLGPASLVRLLGSWRVAGGGAGYRRLADGLRLLVLDGRVPLGIRLPGERELAAALGVSRTTVAAAYALLRDEGYLASRAGSGSVTRLPGGPGARVATPLAGAGTAGVIDLAAAALPAGEAVHRAYAAALAALPAHLPGHGYEPVGIAPLRRAIADRYAQRGVPTTPAHILVTGGAHHGLALLLRLLAGPGDRVVIDHPTYPHAIDAIQRAAARPVPVTLAQAGWDVEALAAAFRQTAPRLAYLIADFHNPTGAVMDADSRAALAVAAARTRTLLVADETLVDLWLDAPPPPSFAAHDRDGWVATLGSTAKSFWGGLRIGWVRADPALIAALAGVRASLDLGTPVVEQLAATALLAEEAPLLAARRDLLRPRRDALCALIADRLPDWRIASPLGGLSAWAELPAPLSTALAAAAEAEGVRIVAGPRFGVDGAFERFVRLPFTLPEAELATAVDRLAAAWRKLGPAPAQRAAAAPAAIV